MQGAEVEGRSVAGSEGGLGKPIHKVEVKAVFIFDMIGQRTVEGRVVGEGEGVGQIVNQDAEPEEEKRASSLAGEKFSEKPRDFSFDDRYVVPVAAPFFFSAMSDAGDADAGSESSERGAGKAARERTQGEERAM